MAKGTHEYRDDPRNADVLIYVNGELVPRDQATISVFDSGFVLGDGVHADVGQIIDRGPQGHGGDDGGGAGFELGRRRRGSEAVERDAIDHAAPALERRHRPQQVVAGGLRQGQHRVGAAQRQAQAEPKRQPRAP